MKNLTAALAGAGGTAVVTLAVVLGATVASGGSPEAAGGKQVRAKDAVTTPVEPPHESVDPSVADEMNGPQKNVHLAQGVKMNPAKPVPPGLIGKGQGNGCLKNYGKPGECLPVVSLLQEQMPEMDHPWTCDQVRELFPSGIVVHGQDTLALDTNANHVACDAGDG